MPDREVVSSHGYANDDTWGVAVAIENDQGIYDDVKQVARRFYDKGRNAGALAVWLALNVPDMPRDLFGSWVDLSNVDYTELAQDFWDEMNEEL